MFVLGHHCQHICQRLVHYVQVLVQDNNLYYKQNVNAVLQTVTTDGKPGELYNGVPDWVYEGIAHLPDLSPLFR